MVPPKSDVPPPVVQRENDNPSASSTTTDSSLKLWEASIKDPVTLGAEQRYGRIDLSSQSLAPFGDFTLYTPDINAGTGNSISMEAQLTIDSAMPGLTQSIGRDAAAVENLVHNTEAAAASGNYEQLAQNMAAAYTMLKDRPEVFQAFRDSLQNALEDDHITVDGGAGNGVVGLLLHKEGTATGLEIVAGEGADGKPVVTGRGYDFQNNAYLEAPAGDAARDLAARFDPVVEAKQALEFSRNMPEIKAMDTDGNGRVSIHELRAFEAQTQEQQAAREYLVAHFDAIATATGTQHIDVNNIVGLQQFPQLQTALNTTIEQLEGRPMTKANILAARQELNRAIGNGLLNQPTAHGIQRQLDQVLQNFDALRIATAPPGSLGISENDRLIGAARAAVRGLSESVIRASKNGTTPKPEIDLNSIMNATNNPEQMAKLLPAIINAANESILRSTNYRFEMKRTKGTDTTGDRTTLRLLNQSVGLQQFATSFDH